MRGVFWLLLIVSACSPSSMSDFRHEGEARARAIAEQLGQIETREQLLQAEPQLKKHFEALVDLMIEAREFQDKHMEEVAVEPFSEERADHALEEELRRVYTIEGAREVIERAQQEALVRLDAYERTRLKKRER